MVRAPCCEKMGLKKGPWTRQEDQILIDYITLYGHGNWRALPKQAGLLRCGKSCRLRWTNYLRPDIKRGNFTREEEDTIINLHGLLGNRWSAIAARLPGRTDNEIKNVWHTHLKKRVVKNVDATPETKQSTINTSISEQKMEMQNEEEEEVEEEESKAVDFNNQTSSYQSSSPQHSSSTEISSVTTTTSDNDSRCMKADSILDNFPQVDDDFWLEVFSDENSGETSNFPAVHGDTQLQFPSFPLYDNGCGYSSNLHDGMDFWYDIFTRTGELPEF